MGVGDSYSARFNYHVVPGPLFIFDQAREERCPHPKVRLPNAGAMRHLAGGGDGRSGRLLINRLVATSRPERDKLAAG
jgi:hypothetical protein